MPAGGVYKYVVDGVRDFALYFVDPSGIVQSWNPGAERLHGYSSEEIVGRSYAELFLEEDRTAGVPEAELRAAEKSDVSESRWMMRKDGSRFWSTGSCSAVRDEHGELVGFSRVARDASGRQRLEKMVERTSEELNRFAFIVSHDLQEPVRTMKSYGELLARRYQGKLDSDADDFINFMTDAANRMTQLLKDLLSYSQAGRADRTHPEPTPADTALQWAIMNVNPQIKDTGAAVTYDPLPTVFADQSQLAQLFQHLLHNALKFRGADPPKVHVTSTQINGTHHRFCVTDNGIGVAKEFHERIFGVFKRLHGKDIPGTGIGLSICRKIVEAHGGELWIESQPGSGASFYFDLPST
jgi:PAS domain S-box-containing protein